MCLQICKDPFKQWVSKSDIMDMCLTSNLKHMPSFKFSRKGHYLCESTIPEFTSMDYEGSNYWTFLVTVKWNKTNK